MRPTLFRWAEQVNVCLTDLSRVGSDVFRKFSCLKVYFSFFFFWQQNVRLQEDFITSTVIDGNNRHLQHENTLQKERKHESVAWEKLGVKSVSEEIVDYHQLLHQDSTVEDALKITIELATQAS